MERRGPDSDAGTLAGFAEYLAQHSTSREDIKTWFDALELDDYANRQPTGNGQLANTLIFKIGTEEWQTILELAVDDGWGETSQ